MITTYCLDCDMPRDLNLHGHCIVCDSSQVATSDVSRDLLSYIQAREIAERMWLAEQCRHSQRIYQWDKAKRYFREAVAFGFVLLVAFVGWFLALAR